MKLKLIAVGLVIMVMALATSTAEAASSLAQLARYTALHGGVTGTCQGCSTPTMKLLMVKVYEARFASAGPWAQRTAVCLMEAESGANPGAVSHTNDYGGPQINYSAHHVELASYFRPARGFTALIFDPAFGAGAMWAMSRAGTSWRSWTGTYGRGMCHF